LAIFAETNITMDSLVITPKSKKAIPFLKRLLESLDQVKQVRIVPAGSEEEVEDAVFLEEMLKAREEGFLSTTEKSDFLRSLKQTAGL